MQRQGRELPLEGGSNNFERVSGLKYLGSLVIEKKWGLDIRVKINPENTCYCCMHCLFGSHTLSKKSTKPYIKLSSGQKSLTLLKPWYWLKESRTPSSHGNGKFFAQWKALTDKNSVLQPNDLTNPLLLTCTRFYSPNIVCDLEVLVWPKLFSFLFVLSICCRLW